MTSNMHHISHHICRKEGLGGPAEVICDAGDMRGKFAHEAIKQIGAIDENQIAIIRVQARRNSRVQACNSRPATADRGSEIRKLAPPGLTLLQPFPAEPELALTIAPTPP